MGAALNRVACMVGALLLVGAAQAYAADVTEADRSFKTFTRDSAVVGDNQLRLEIQGMTLHQSDRTLRTEVRGTDLVGIRPASVNLLGYRTDAQRIDGGMFDLLGAYGIANRAEVGFLVPFLTESRRDPSGVKDYEADVGDVELYGKFKQDVAEHCSVSGGAELTVPTGVEHKEFGTGEVSVNPFVSTRYDYKAFGVGAYAAYQISSGHVPDVFGYGIDLYLRGGPSYVFRTELTGRVFHQRGSNNHDLTIWPGIDYSLTDRVSIRPTGMVGATDLALDWGLALGVSYTLF